MLKKLILCVLCLITVFSNAQNNKILKGTILDKQTEQGLESVTINIKGTKKNVLTNKMGNFEINFSSPKTTLVFSLVGYQSQELEITNLPNEPLKIYLVSQTQSLNDVVVIGYGTRKRKELTTAVSSVTSKEITQSPVSDAAQAIQGKVSGVTIVQGSGAPGGTGGNRIFIRGASSITGSNNPLIVVDGFPLPDQNSDNILNAFSVNDIENIDVLKDAAAASIYGVRGSNGVIIITTKRGKAGKTQVSADIYRGQQEVYNLISMLNAKDYANLNTQARITGGSLPIAKLKDPAIVESIYGEGTNWLNEIFRKAAKQSVAITALGGSENTQFSLNAGYLKEDGIIYNTDFERFSVRFNGDIKLNKKFKIGNSISLTKTIEHPKNTYNAFNSIVIEALTSPPTVSPYTPTGGYAGGDGNIDGFSEPNPVYDLEVPSQTINKYRITGNIFAELEIVKNLKFKSSLGTDYVFTNIKSFNPEIPATGGKPFATSALGNERGEFTSNLVENTLTYQNTFNQKHAVTAFVGITYQENLYDVLVGSRSGTFSQLIPELDNRVLYPLTTGNVNAYSYSGVGAKYISYVSRINYDYDGKYFAMLSIRQDGSSNFAPANKFATFPSFSAGWRLSKEKFIEKLNWINDLKLRASFGYTGNPNVTPNAYLAQVFQANATSFGQTVSTTGGVNTLAPLSPSNPDIKWEKQQQLDIGFDASLFNNKIGIAFDYFDKISKDLILNVIPPFVTGTPGSVPYNTGEVENKGIDISINASIIATNTFKWNTNLILTSYTNNVNNLGASAPINYNVDRIDGGGLRVDKGFPINYFYGFLTDGIFQTAAEVLNGPKQVVGTDPAHSTAPGDIRFKDINNDGVIDDKDRTYLGNSIPDFTFGWTNIFSYQNVDLTIFIQGSQGNKVLNFNRWYIEGGVSNGNYSQTFFNTRWTGPGTSNTTPRAIFGDPNNNSRVSDRFVEDASYIRLKNIKLQYNFSTNILKKINLKKMGIYISAQNVITLTKYTGFDPEVGGGVDYGFYPQSRTLTAGIIADF